MSLKYRVAKCVNPSGTAGTLYACCKAWSRKEFRDNDIVNCIATNTSYTKADVVGVVNALKTKLLDYMLAGIHVDLKDGVTDLGIFSPRITSECFTAAQAQAEDFDPLSKIKNVNPGLRISVALQEEFRDKAKLERIPSTLMP